MLTKKFILAGQAIFTVECPDGKHYTYRVERVEANDSWPEAWFCGLLTGPDNTSDYSYIGKLDPLTSEVRHTKKSFVPVDAFSFRLVNRVLARLWSGDAAAIEKHGYKVHHEGRCGRCGRALTVPSSVESGFGPECIKKVG